MKSIEPDFSNYSFSSEMRELYSDLQLCLGVSSPNAELVIRQAAMDAQQMAEESESVEYGMPIRFGAEWEYSNNYALSLVRLCLQQKRVGHSGETARCR
jgi:hypothetical protein